MAQVTQLGARRTSVDDIFDRLRDDILALRLRPGDKISEADVATQFGVSRQPVRDAFSRLANLNLLLIRPQRATEVKRFSMREIVKSRFVRAALDAEVLRRAAAICDAQGAARLDEALKQQEQAIKDDDVETFGTLDYAFHQTLCEIAQVDFAFDVIMAEKSKVDRLCLLSLSKENRMPDLLVDHQAIAQAVKAHDPEKAVEVGMHHLARLDDTIEAISTTNADYFEPSDL